MENKALEFTLPTNHSEELMDGSYSLRRGIIAVIIGNILNCYDFVVFAIFSQEISETYFSRSDPIDAMLGTLALFWAGFLLRPVGALVIGRIADRTGRVRALTLSFWLMGGSMFGLALAPGHGQLGLLAAFLVLGLRLLQGFAFGGELASSTAWLMEIAPSRHQTVISVLGFATQDLAIVIAGAVGIAVATVEPAYAANWPLAPWRIAMLFGASLVPIGIWLRRDLVETLKISVSANEKPTDPDFAPNRGSITSAFFALSGISVASYLQLYLLTHTTQALGYVPRTGFGLDVILGLTSLVSFPLGGWLVDRIGRKPVMTIAWPLLIVPGLASFLPVARLGSPLALATWTIAFSSCFAIACAAVFVTLLDLFPPNHRGRGFGLYYALAVVMFGGSAQFIAEALTQATGAISAPLWYMAAVFFVAWLAILRLAKAPANRLS